MLIAVRIIEDVEHLFHFLDSPLYARSKVYVLDLGRYER